MEILKLEYEVRYPKMLNFRDIYKEIINPYFILPNAKYTLSNEGIHSEAIRMTFPDSKCSISFSYDRIGFHYDGAVEDQTKPNSFIDKCFEIYREVKKVKTFTKVSSEFVGLTGFRKNTQTSQDKIVDYFLKTHNLISPFPKTFDLGIIIEGGYKSGFAQIRYGPFNGESDPEQHGLFELDLLKEKEFREKKGMIISCGIRNISEQDVSKKTFKDLVTKGSNYITKTLENYDKSRKNR